MNGLALCAGIGGLELGVRASLGGSYRTVCFVEREAFCAAVLVARMEDATLDAAPVWDDLKTFDGRPWRGVVDLVTAGYPCQPFSVAGRRAGVDDPRHLWPHVARIIREVGPRLVFLENVPGHLSLGFEDVVQDLEGMGYRVAAGLFRAEEVGSPQRRERLFVLAHATGPVANPGRVDRAGWGVPGNMGGPSATPEGIEEKRKRGRGAADDRERPMADPDSTRLEKREPGPETDARPTAWPPGPSGDWTGVPAPLWPATTEPELRGMATGIPDRLDRLRALGNSVCPAQAELAFLTLAAQHSASPSEAR